MDGKVDVDPKIDNVHSFPMQSNAMLRIGHCVVQKLSENGLITFTLNKNGDIGLNAVRCQKNDSVCHLRCFVSVSPTLYPL